MAAGPKSLDAARHSMQRGELQQAELLLDELNRQPDQRTLESLLLHGRCLEALQRFTDSAAAFQAAEPMAAEPREQAKILNKAAALLQQKGALAMADMEKIAACLEKSVSLDPSETNVLADINLCSAYFTIHRYDAVTTCANRLLKFPAYRAVANLWLARACYFLDDKSQGLVYLSEPENTVDSLSESDQFGTLELLVDYQSFDRAQIAMNRIRAQRKNAAWFRELQAKIYLEDRNYDAVLEIVSESFIRGCKDDTWIRSLHGVRAKALHATGNYSAAHDSFTAMNRLARAAYGQPRFDDVVAHYSAVALRKLPAFRSSETPPYIPVFMIGFPRSGTTLLDTILETQAHIRTLSEVDGVSVVKRSMTALGKVWPVDLPVLTEPEVGRLREVYYGHNSQFLSTDDEFSVLVDKLPLNIVHLPLIKTLFPDAKYIFSLRHPVDVCLSCFQQDFSLNDEMLYFTDLEQCFIRYRDIMSLFETYREELKLDLHTVRYEDLVADLDTVAGQVFRFLGIQADQSYRDFYKANRDKLIVTPSRAQVSQPMYQSSRNRWKNYADELRPHIPFVQEFVTRYGYDI